MRRLLPRSLAAQMLLLLGAALLVAQLVNFALILNERQKLSLAQDEQPAITYFAQVASDLRTAAPDLRGALLTDMSRRGARFSLQPGSDIDEAQREAHIEERLSTALAGYGVRGATVRGAFREDIRPVAADAPPAPARRWLMLALQQDDGRWLIGRLPVPPRDEWLAHRLALATLAVYVIVLGASGWAALRLARPLRDLTRAARQFAGRDAPITVRPAGPEDLRDAIEAFNEMNRRVSTLLDDKDRMLGALGHDLRTPLASLRLRVENLDASEDRDAAIAKIAEMSAMIEEILILARSGRMREPAKRVDIAAMVEILVDEQRDLGRDVVMTSDERVDADIHPHLLSRAVSNLIDNAVKYGGSAKVSVVRVPEGAEIRIADEGPGLSPEERERVLEPFYRGESSRNRATGGTGLGLAIARNVAESHGGTLRLEANPAAETGLAAILFLPG